MKRQAFNPFLPSYEYIPDGEPHVFGDRVYLYGSHDKFNGRFFCMNDYVCYSAPVSDLSDWKYEGVIWKKSDDPFPRPLLNQLYAPDVTQGSDGRFYLYYFKGNTGVIGVAVCDTPAGKYEYYGHVRYPDGTLLGRKKEKDFHQFDPGVFKDDDGRIYLYTGFAPKNPNIFSRFKPVNKNGAMGVELEKDMLTVKPETFSHIGKTVHCSKGSDFEGHEFFEASSMRKFDGKYYFIYSSAKGHELCYAVGDSPLGEFAFGGTLVSIGDLGIKEKPTNYLGNTHGSVEKINGEYYVFYHRQTNRHCHSRQACAERITFEKGHFLQAEVTSAGLNGEPLKGIGRYQARVACNLWSRRGVKFYTAKTPAGVHPYFTQTEKDGERGDQYIANFCDGASAGFKYFSFGGAESGIALTVSGAGGGEIIVSHDPFGEEVARLSVPKGKGKRRVSSRFTPLTGKRALFFRYSGKGRVDFIDFEIK